MDTKHGSLFNFSYGFDGLDILNCMF